MKLSLAQKTWDKMLINAWVHGWALRKTVFIFAVKVMKLELNGRTTRELRDELSAMGIMRLPPNWALYCNPGVWFADVCPGFVEAYLNRPDKTTPLSFDLTSIKWNVYGFQDVHKTDVERRKLVRRTHFAEKGMRARRIGRGIWAEAVNAPHDWHTVK